MDAAHNLITSTRRHGIEQNGLNDIYVRERRTLETQINSQRVYLNTWTKNRTCAAFHYLNSSAVSRWIQSSKSPTALSVAKLRKYVRPGTKSFVTIQFGHLTRTYCHYPTPKGSRLARTTPPPNMEPRHCRQTRPAQTPAAYTHGYGPRSPRHRPALPTAARGPWPLFANFRPFQPPAESPHTSLDG